MQFIAYLSMPLPSSPPSPPSLPPTCAQLRHCWSILASVIARVVRGFPATLYWIPRWKLWCSCHLSCIRILKSIPEFKAIYGSLGMRDSSKPRNWAIITFVSSAVFRLSFSLALSLFITLSLFVPLLLELIQFVTQATHFAVFGRIRNVCNNQCCCAQWEKCHLHGINCFEFED